MTDPHDGPGDVTAPGNSAPAAHQARWAALADRPSPPAPNGRAAGLADRILVYLRPGKVDTVLPHLDTRHSGVILAGASPGKGLQALEGIGAAVPRLIDPACHENYTATCDAPFLLPEGWLDAPSLDDVLDDQLQAGVTVALTPTGYIPAGRTDILRAAARQFSQLGRDDVIFVAPLDVSLVDRAYIKTTTAILASLDSPVALILGRQFDPLDQSKRIIPNLRELAATIPLMPARTDFNGFDLTAHGAFAAAIGTGGSLRHAVSPLEKPLAFRRKGQAPDPAPSVLVPELVSWFKGSKIARLFGARPQIVPRCHCPVCQGQRLDRFLKREDQDDAIAHGVAVWSRWAADLLDQPTVRDRAVYWRNLCCGAVATHAVFRSQLKILDERTLQPQGPLGVWAAQPAWPAESTPATV
jgi:hypothetical protein